MTAFGYVRKGVMSDDSTTLSPAVQPERVAARAKAHGDDDPTILEDGEATLSVRPHIRLSRLHATP